MRVRQRGLGALVRRLERAMIDASIRWRFRHAMSVERERPGSGCHDLVIVLDHLAPRHNIGRIIRSAEIFGAREVHIVGTRRFDTATATTALHEVPLCWLDRIEDSLEPLLADGYDVVVLENLDEPTREELLQHASLGRKTALVVGNEGKGISFSRQDFPEARWLMVEQFGRTRCLDAGAAASIALYEYTRQWGGASEGSAPE